MSIMTGGQVSFSASLVEAGPAKTITPVSGATYTCAASRDGAAQPSCPAGAMNSNGDFSWSPTGNDEGSWIFTITATAGTTSTSRSFTQYVRPASPPPFIFLASPKSTVIIDLANMAAFTVSGVCYPPAAAVDLLADSTHFSQACAADGSFSRTLNLSAAPAGSLTVTTSITDGSKSATSSKTYTKTTDGTPPTVTLSTLASFPNSLPSVQVSAALSEAVTGFDLSDVTVSNGSASNFSCSSLSCSFDVAPSADGLVSVSVSAGRFQDMAGNPNTASNTFFIKFIKDSLVLGPVSIDPVVLMP